MEKTNILSMLPKIEIRNKNRYVTFKIKFSEYVRFCLLLLLKIFQQFVYRYHQKN